MKVGVDWGGTKIEVAVLNNSGEFLWRERKPTPKNDYDGCISLVHDLVLTAENAVGGNATVGVGIPGTLSPDTGLVKNANSTWMNGRPLDKDLSAAVGRPVRLANDANCLALSEAVDGAGADSHCVFAVILGTGVGGGIAINKSLHQGRSIIAGEWGHNPLPWPEAHEIPGPLCWCGRRGCMETYVSGSGLTMAYFRKTGGVLTGEAIVAAMGDGNLEAKTCFDQLKQRLARGLASVINLLDPNVIVFGGGLSNIPELYKGLDELIAPFVFTDVFNTKIIKAKHGDSSGVRGAAWLWD